MKSLYIHIPFCNRICSYCDFPKVFYNGKIMEYLKSLEKEIKENYNDDLINTIYIGGGTPSSLNIEELKELFRIINNNINRKKVEEYTIECNIDSITEEKLILFKQNKVNRLSIGIQSFDKETLEYLNRTSDVNQIEILMLCKKYFDNINIDLLYGIPGMNIKKVKYDLEKFLNLDIPHISYYSLIIEPHTKLYINNTSNIDEDEEYDMYNLVEDTLNKNGYIHYETSNYAKKDFQSKHNLTYWNNEEYYGFGLGASGFINNVRYSNTRSITEYINGNLNREEELMTKQTNMENEMILGLRKLEGVSKTKFYNKYGIEIDKYFDIKDLIQDKKLIEENGYLKINKEYIYLSNDILVRFIK